MGSTRSRTRRVAAATTLALIASMVGLVAGAPTAGAATIVVSTTADGGPGSLRTAIDAANAAAAPTTITLASGATYDLTQCGTGPDDTNATGDLDLSAVHPVTIQGNGATIHQTCSGERVVHSLAGTGGLTISGATITGGRGPAGIAIWSGASLSLDHVTVSDSIASSAWPLNPAAVATFGSGSLVLTASSIIGTQEGVGITDTQSGGSFTVSGTTISGNGSPTGSYAVVAGGILGASRDLTISDSTVSDNNVSGVPLPPPSGSTTFRSFAVGGIAMSPSTSAPHGLHAERLTVRGNGGPVEGIYADPAHLVDSMVTGNWGYYSGGILGGSVDLVDARLTDNHADSVGGFIGRGTISGSTITGNTGVVGGGAADQGATTISRSTITKNVGDVVGGLTVFPGENGSASVLLDHVTLAGNGVTGARYGPPRATDLDVDPTAASSDLRASSSIIGQPGSSAPSCGHGGNTAASSLGFNLLADTSCFVTPSASDAVGVDPLLGPLTDNGGPTATRVPAPLSPARDRIPASDPACAGTDQRGVDRPQGPGCDAGAVEAHLGGFVAQPPVRVLDTRDGTGVAKGPISGTVTVDLPSMPAGTTAAVVNVTADRPTAESFLSISPPGTNGATAVSNLNFPAGRTIANLVTVPIVDPAHPELVVHNNSGATHVIADLAGTYRETEPTPTGDGFTATSPKRILDTRPGTTIGGPAAPFGPGVTRTVAVAGVDGIPADITAVAVNLTVTQTTAASHLTAGPTGAPLPQVSNLNWPAGDTIANQAIVPVGPNGAIQLRNNAGQTQVIADVAGWFRASGGAGFRPVTPTRILDTRPATPIGGAPGRLGPGGVRTLDSPLVPTGTTAVVANLTGALPTATTHLTAWPTGTLLPTASNLNLPVLTVRPVLATVAVDAQGRFDLRNNSGFTDAVADLQGYFG